MKKISKFIISCIMLILLINMQSCTNQTKTAPQNPSFNSNYDSDSILKVSKDEINIGEINKNDKTSVKFAFELTNSSSSSIAINKVDVSCSCVKVNYFPKLINSKQSSKLTGEIDLKNQSGHVRKSIFVSFNDTCVKVLKIVADVE